MTNKYVESLDGEVWKDIIGYEGLYQFSNKLRVKSLIRKGVKKERLLVQTPNNIGYLAVNLSKNGDHKTTYIHQLSWEYANDRPVPEGFDVNHISGVITDNRPENLNVMSHKENCNQATQGKTPAEKRWDNPAWVAHIKQLAQMKPTKQVTAINLKTNEHTIYNSVTEAQDATGVARSTIKRISDNKQYQSNGYVFSYDEATNFIYHMMSCKKLAKPDMTMTKHVDWKTYSMEDYFADITGKEA